MKNFVSVSPLSVLEKSSGKGLGPGNLGVLIARAGVGKTACLVHIAFHKLFHGDKLVHVSLGEGPEKVASYYNVMFYELAGALGDTDTEECRMRMERDRMILAYLNESFDMDRLRGNLGNLSEKLGFRPDVLIVDGLEFEKADRALFEGFRQLAETFQMEVWFSALSHRHIQDVNERGIPYPCNGVDDLFSIILQLQPEASGVVLKLLKDHDARVAPDASVRLDPGTFLAMEGPARV